MTFKIILIIIILLHFLSLTHLFPVYFADAACAKTCNDIVVDGVYNNCGTVVASFVDVQRHPPACDTRRRSRIRVGVANALQSI